MTIRLPFSIPFASAVCVWPFIVLSRDVAKYSAYTQAIILTHQRVHLRQQAVWVAVGAALGSAAISILFSLGVALAWWLSVALLLSGLIAHHAAYVLLLPVAWNPWRKRVEIEAFRAQGLGDAAILLRLREAPYWLRW